MDEASESASESSSSPLKSLLDGYVFIEQSLDNVFASLRQRIKYSCIDVAERYLALGANTGSVYIYDRPDAKARRDLRHREMLASAEGEVTCLKFSPNQAFIAVGFLKGSIVIFELNFDQAKEKPKQILKIGDHKDQPISSLVWNPTSDRIYSGDEMGTILGTPVGEKLKNLLRGSEVMQKADSKIVQLDFVDDKLLASTLTKCIIFHTSKQAAAQVGKKARQGPFGATFSKNLIYSARPGLRLWSADVEGTVLATLNFKGFFSASPSSLIKVEGGPTPRLVPNPPEDSQFKDPALNFAQMLKPFGGQAPVMLSWQENTLYLIDLEEVCIPKWLNQFTAIRDVAVWGNDIYILHGEAKRFTCVSLAARAEVFENMAREKSWDVAYFIASEHQSYLVDNFLSVKQLFEFAAGDESKMEVLKPLFEEAQLKFQRDLKEKYSGQELANPLLAESQDGVKEKETDTDSISSIGNKSVHSMGSMYTEEGVGKVEGDVEPEDPKQPEKVAEEIVVEKEAEKEAEKAQPPMESPLPRATSDTIPIPQAPIDEEEPRAANSAAASISSLVDEPSSAPKEGDNSATGSFEEKPLEEKPLESLQHSAQVSKRSSTYEDSGSSIERTASEESLTVALANFGLDSKVEVKKRTKKTRVIEDIQPVVRGKPPALASPAVSEPDLDLQAIMNQSSPPLQKKPSTTTTKASGTTKKKVKHARSPSGNDLVITPGLSKRSSTISLGALESADEDSPLPATADTESLNESEDKTPLSSRVVSPLPSPLPAEVRGLPPAQPEKKTPPISVPAAQSNKPLEQQSIPIQQTPGNQVGTPQAPLPLAKTPSQSQMPNPSGQPAQPSVWKTQKGLLKDFVGEGLKELKNTTLEAISMIKEPQTPGSMASPPPTENDKKALKRQDSILDKKGAENPPVPVTTAPATTPQASQTSQPPAQAPSTYVSPNQVQQIVLLSEKALACVRQQQHNLNGYHPVTWVVLFEWFSYFSNNIWKKEEEAMRIIDQRKAGVRLLLTACFELGVISVDGKPGKGEKALLEDEPASLFIEEYRSYIDLNTALKIANELGLEKTVAKIFFYEDQINTSDEKKLSLESFLSYNDSERSFELLKNNPPNQLSLVLRSMSRLIELDSASAIKLFISMYPQLTIHNVRKCLEPRFEDQAVAIFYLDYLNHLLSNGPASCRRDRKLILECFTLNMVTSKVDKYAVFEEQLGTGTFKPKRGSYNTNFLNEDFFLTILSSPKKYNIDFEGMLKASSDFGFWKAHLLLLMEKGKSTKAIELALQLDDVDALGKAVEGNTTTQMWEFIISHLSEIRTRRFSLAPVPNPITEETLIRLMVADLGPRKTIDILLLHPYLCESLRPDFFEQFVVEAVKTHERHEIVHSMLEVIDGYLWIRKANSMAPPVRHIKDLELAENATKSNTATNQSRSKLRNLPYLQFGGTSGPPSRFAFDLAMTTPYPRYLEEPDIQWGVCCDIGGGSCPVCTLPLVEGVSASLANVVLLECGHGFHQMCLVEEVCVVCFAKERTSLFDWNMDPLV